MWRRARNERRRVYTTRERTVVVMPLLPQAGAPCFWESGTLRGS